MTTTSDISPQDAKLISAIVDRGLAMNTSGRSPIDREAMINDLSIVHSKVTPMRLEDMLKSDDFNLLHDLHGIERHLNPNKTGFWGAFRPRFAV